MDGRVIRVRCITGLGWIKQRRIVSHKRTNLRPTLWTLEGKEISPSYSVRKGYFSVEIGEFFVLLCVGKGEFSVLLRLFSIEIEEFSVLLCMEGRFLPPTSCVLLELEEFYFLLCREGRFLRPTLCVLNRVRRILLPIL